MLYALRTVWLIIKYLVIGLLIVACLAIGFFVAMDTANVYIIVTEGMHARAETIIEGTQNEEINSYFTTDYLAQDPAYKESPYAQCSIQDYNYNLSVKSLWCEPWNNTASVIVEESVPYIVGTMPTSDLGDDGNPVTVDPPQWPHARYEITCQKIDDKWIITNISLAESLPAVATPTDEPILTLAPTTMIVTPTPSATIQASTASPGRIVTAIADCRIRSGPSTSDASIGVLSQGDTLALIEQQGQWCKVQVDINTIGYIYAELVEIN